MGAMRGKGVKIERVRTCLKKRDGVYGIWIVHTPTIPRLDDIMGYLETDCSCMEFIFDNKIIFTFWLEEDKLIVNVIKQCGNIYSHKFTKKEKAEMMDFLNLTYGGFYDCYKDRGRTIYFEKKIDKNKTSDI